MSMITIREQQTTKSNKVAAVADPDFELRRGSGSILLAKPAFLLSAISSFFTQNRGPPIDPPLCGHLNSLNTPIAQLAKNLLG